MKFRYQCSECGAFFDLDPALNTCPDCRKNQKENEPLRGVLEVRLEGDLPSSGNLSYNMLPVPREFFPSLPDVTGKLWQPARLRKEMELPRLFIMNDGSNPTGSFKDRASVLVSAYAKQCGIDSIVLASTGNAGSSMSGIGAAADQKIVLFLPETAPPAKLIQALQYNATLYKVAGNYDMAYELSLEYSEQYGGMNRNTAWNPMTMEGKKTISLDIFSQLGEKAPDRVIVPTGDACILGGVYKGFKDLLQYGLIKKMPKITAVQAEGSSALYRAWQKGSFDLQSSRTVADSISVDIPRNGYTALRYLKKFNGDVITVTDEQIIEAQAHLSCGSGLFTEPAGAAAWAGLRKMHHTIDKDETVVVLATGSGLKDTATALKGVKMPGRSIHNIQDIRG
ncbi:MAG: threonine synthase [Spirochaetaceae bacterium 4572_59]|nr:MAG: threonine synthase [Spirochaetaceae bacterium 4572_59]